MSPHREIAPWKGSFRKVTLTLAQSIRKGVTLVNPLPYLRLSFPISKTRELDLSGPMLRSWQVTINSHQL